MRCLFIFFLLPFFVKAQYAPPAGIPGSTAIFKDSILIKSWATACWIFCGPMDISHPENGLATNGNSENAFGKANNLTVSLGDGGTAILKFNPPIINGPGNDFVIFENGFTDNFLELAFVEVSSDSINFYRFNSVSLTDTNVQVGSFDTLDATKINNLAGKYRGLFGTPFDLEELKNNSGLQIDSIRYIKIIDVKGSINNLYTSYDSQGHKINDPWPTPFESSGFDLDAVGIINQATNNIDAYSDFNNPELFPNPAKNFISIYNSPQKTELKIFDLSGKCMRSYLIESYETLDISKLPQGIYFIHIKNKTSHSVKKLIKN